MGAKGARCSMNIQGAQRKILSTLHPNTISKANLDSGGTLSAVGAQCNYLGV